MCLAGEHRIEEGCGAIKGRSQVCLETNLLGEAGIVRYPLGRWGGQASRKRLAAAGLEGVLQRLAHRGGFERLRVCNEQDVDQVLGPRAGPARRAIAPGVCVDLLAKCWASGIAGSSSGSIPAKERKSDVRTLPGSELADFPKPTSTMNCSKTRSASSART